jgi:hypothetical protein
MKIKHNELEIKTENPFANCKLNREQYAEILTDIVSSYADGFVLAIDNEWGTGKTTFVKMWQQYLINSDFQTLYFNAWENDFGDNPLVAIMAELGTLVKGDRKGFNSLLKYIAIFGKSALKTIPLVGDGLSEILENEINDYNDKKISTVNFKKALQSFVEQTKMANNKSNPLIFIIDELDRCRPSYAVEVLERIKHLFSVEGIVFVLAIDKVQLGHAIRGVYGCDKINADEYLRRFIDLEYSIPKPSVEQFCRYLYDYYMFEEQNGFRKNKESLIEMAIRIFEKEKSNLRQMEKIFAHTRLIVSMFDNNKDIFPHLLFLLVYIRIIKTGLYMRIDEKSITLQELSNEFTNMVGYEKHINMNLLVIEAELLCFYNNQKNTLIEKGENDKNISPIKSKLDNTNGIQLAQYFMNIDRRYNLDNLNLSYLLNKISLTEHLITNTE